MANCPESFIQSDISEFQSVTSSALPEVEVVLGLIRNIVEIITLA